MDGEYIKYFIDEERNRDTIIEKTSFPYNINIHEGIKFTLHELVFGQTARVPSFSSPPFTSLETYSSYLTDLFHKIRDLQDTAKANRPKHPTLPASTRTAPASISHHCQTRANFMRMIYCIKSLLQKLYILLCDIRLYINV